MLIRGQPRGRGGGSGTGVLLGPGVDERDWLEASLHFARHLTPGAGPAEERIGAVIADGARDAVAVAHGRPQRQGDGRYGAEAVQ